MVTLCERVSRFRLSKWLAHLCWCASGFLLWLLRLRWLRRRRERAYQKDAARRRRKEGSQQEAKASGPTSRP